MSESELNDLLCVAEDNANKFGTMTKKQALEYCYKHENAFKADCGEDGSR